jgi:hypothetical protein
MEGEEGSSCSREMGDGRWRRRWEMGEVLVLARWKYEVLKACKGEFLEKKEVVYKYGGLQSIFKFNDGYQQ